MNRRGRPDIKMESQKAIRGVGLNHRELVHFTDHLGPICAGLEIPLAVTDPSSVEMTRTCYPGLEVLDISPEVLTPEWVLGKFDVLFQSDPWAVRPEPETHKSPPGVIPDWEMIKKRHAFC